MTGLEGVKTLEVILTASCNLACSYCYQDDKKDQRMSWDTLQAALDRVLGAQPESLNVFFIGGEPLTESPLMRRAVRYIADTYARTSVSYSISTNGLLMDDVETEFLVQHRISTQLSFDGVPAAQRERGAGTHARLDALLDHLRATQPAFYREQLSINITLQPSTIRYVADSVAYFLGKDIRELAISPLSTHAHGWTPEAFQQLRHQFDRVLELSVQHYRQTGLIPFDRFHRTQEPSMHAPRGRQVCGVGSGQSLTVDVDGQVAGCVKFATSYQDPPEFLARRFAAMAMGDVRADDLPQRLAMYPAAAAAAQIFDRKQDKYSSYGNCRDCRHFVECSYCPTAIGFIPGNDDPRRVPDFLCAFNLVTLDARARFPRQPTAAEQLMGQAPLPEFMRALQSAVHHS